MIPFFGQGDFQSSANMTPQQIERKRALMAALMPRFGSAKYVGEGLGQLATGIAMGRQGRKLDQREGENETERQGIMDRITGGLASRGQGGGTGFSILGQTPAAPPADSPEGIANDTMAALGKPPIVTRPEAYRGAIASIESAGSGDYAAVGPTHPKMGRALGRYQVMEANIGPWSREVLGREVTPEEFMANPQLQDQIFDAKFGSYVDRFGEQGAAQAWFGGPGGVGKTGRKDVLGTSVGDYGNKFAAALGQSPITVSTQGGPADQGSGEVDLAMLYSALASPLLRDEDRAVINSLIQQRQQEADPMRQMQMEKAQLELAQMRQPQAPKGVVVGGRIVDPSTGQVIYQSEEGAAGATEYGLQPQYGVDEQGNPVLIQIGKDGTATQTRLPEGVTFQKEPIRIDGGTEWILLDPITRAPVGTVPKQLREAASETAIGKIEGENEANAAAALSGNMAQVDEAVALIDSVMNDPALPGITGMVQGRLPPMSQAGTDLNVKIKQLQGKAFLEAFESLKGGGAITEREGQAATEAMARLDRAQSDEAYRAALAELKAIMRKGAERARAGAGGAAVAPVGDADAELFQKYGIAP